MPVDPRAVSGFSATAAAYDRVRPTYPAAAVAALAAALGVDGGATVLDLAAGTGKLTAPLLAIAGTVVAVDPSAPMLDVLRARLPAARALIGTAEAIPLPDAAVDAVFVGEALHWFAVDRAAHELARVLRPTGGLGLLWNRLRTDATADPRVVAIRGLVTPARVAAGPFPAQGVEAWGPPLVAGGFAPPRRLDVAPHVQRVSAADFLALVGTWSWIVNLQPAARAPLLQRARALVGAAAVTLTHDVECWVVERAAPDRSGPSRRPA